MTDSSRIAESTESAGSSKLQLPTTEQRGSSITHPASDASSTALPISDQPTAISRQPPLHDRTVTLGTLVRTLVDTDLMHFHIEKFVGGGGMGAVFRGHDKSLGRTVAVKVLSRDSLDDEMVRRFQHEARSAAKLDHPSIPHVYFVGEHDSWHFIVFEFIEGNNIRDLVLKNGPLPIEEAVVYLADIAEALQHASSREVVHRDVKPSNVLVTNDGRAKLVDMGLARTEQMQSTADLTATGVTLGTFDYISPEQARDPRNADTRSDIYSLGCTLYFMLTGRPPFPDGTMLQKLLSHTSESPADPSEFRSDVPPKLNEMLARMLAKKPEHRHQDAGDLLGDILLFADDQDIQLNRQGGPGIVVERRIVQDTGWLRHVPWLVPLIVLVVTALGLHAWQGVPSEAPNFLRPPTEEVQPPLPDDSVAESPIAFETLFQTPNSPSDPVTPALSSPESVPEDENR